jgi:hypothetical protein
MDEAHGPAEPVEEDSGKRTGGFAAVAERLNKIHRDRRRPISRQLVYKWYIHRSYNRFPEPTAVTGSGAGRPVFDLATVEDWYVSYRGYRGEEIPQSTDAATLGSQDVRRVSGNEGENSLAA